MEAQSLDISNEPEMNGLAFSPAEALSSPWPQ